MFELILFFGFVFILIYHFRRYCQCGPQGRSPVTIGDYNLYEASDVDDLNKRSHELFTLFQKVLRECRLTIPPEHAQQVRERFDQLFVFHFAINHYHAQLVTGALWWATPAEREAVVISFDMALKRYVKN